MSTTAIDPVSPAKPSAEAAVRDWKAAVSPSLFDLFIWTVLGWTFFAGAKDLGWSQLLSDGDAGWHMRVGQWILEHGRVPTADFFSFSKPGEPWFAWEWLSDVVFALMYNAMGLKGMVWLTAVLFMCLTGVLFYRIVRSGANIFLAVPLAMLGIGVIRIHLLARPHMFTLLLVAVSIWLIERDLARPDRRIYLLVPLTALWVNLHGGWAAIVAILAVTSAGCALESFAAARAWADARRYAILAAACLGVSLLNPYGFELHRHMGAYLDSQWIQNAVEEFQAPRFRSEGQKMFELILIGSVLVTGVLMLRKRFVLPLLLLFWCHASLTSVRHAPILAIIALPALGAELSALWTWALAGARKSSIPGIIRQIAFDMQRSVSKPGLWAAVPFLAILSPALPVKWPSDFPEGLFPVKSIAEYDALVRSARLLTTDEWGDYLLYRNYPSQRVFFDGRSDFYGEKLGREFLRMLGGHWEWRMLLAKHGIDAVLLPPDVALVSLLKHDAEWRLVRDEGKHVLLVRRGGVSEKQAMGLMKVPGTAEVRRGESR